MNMAFRTIRSNDDGMTDDLINPTDNIHGRDAAQNQGDGNPTDNNLTHDSREPNALDQNSPKPVYTSQFATLFIIINVTIGTGLLAMPFAMQTAGIVASMIIQLVFLTLIVITVIMCIELTVKSEVKSYHEMVRKHCHPVVYKLSQVSILLLVFAVTVAFIVIIADQSDRIFASLYGPQFCKNWYMHRTFISIICTQIAIKPLCSARSVDFLKYASFLGVVTIGFIFYVVANNFSNIEHIPKDVNYFPKSWGDVNAILPVFCLAYQCHLSLVPTVATIRRLEKPKAFVTSSIAMIISMIVYSAISILAVLTFGSHIEKDLTESFPGKTWTTLGTIAVVGIKCVFTIPAAFLPARLSLVDILTRVWSRFSTFSERTQRLAVTHVFLDWAMLLAINAPDILTVVNLIGCLSVMFIFTIPGLAYISLVGQNRREKQVAAGLDVNEPLKYTARDHMKLYASYFVIVFGILMTGVVLYKSISELMSSTASQPLCKV